MQHPLFFASASNLADSAPRERPIYYGLFAGVWAVAGSLGPIIGGAFTTSVTWRWCFYLNRMYSRIHTERTKTGYADRETNFQCPLAVFLFSFFYCSSRSRLPRPPSWQDCAVSTGAERCSSLVERSCFSLDSSLAASPTHGIRQPLSASLSLVSLSGSWPC